MNNYELLRVIINYYYYYDGYYECSATQVNFVRWFRNKGLFLCKNVTRYYNNNTLKQS